MLRHDLDRLFDMVLAKDPTVVNQVNYERKTVLHVVCSWHHERNPLKVVKKLLECGADPTATDITVGWPGYSKDL